MTSIDPHDTVDISFNYDQDYRKWVVEDNEPDSWIETSLSVDDEDIYGGSYSTVTGFACHTVLELLDSIEAINSGERRVIQFDYGPSWVTVDPVGTTTVEIAACHTQKGAKNPDERLDIDRVQVVTKDAWVRAVLELAIEFHDTVTDMNPQLYDHEVIAEIRTKTQNVEEATNENCFES